MTKTTDLSQLDLNGTYTYADYLSWTNKPKNTSCLLCTPVKTPPHRSY